MKKEKQAIKTAKKSKSKRAIANVKRARSMKKRKSIHQKFKKEGFLTWGDFILDEGSTAQALLKKLKMRKFDRDERKRKKDSKKKILKYQKMVGITSEVEEETGRDYKKEYEKYHSSPEQRANRSKRVLARRQLEKEGRVCKGDGKDVDHKDGNPQNNDNGNLRVLSAKKNRGRDNNKWRK
jgi:hypothetical protein